MYKETLVLSLIKCQLDELADILLLALHYLLQTEGIMFYDA